MRLPFTDRFVVGMPLAMALLLTLASGCASGNGSFAADGFHHSEYPYSVHYAEPASKSFLGEDWRIDNYVLNYDGNPGDAKRGDDYVGIRELDIHNNGHVYREKALLFDLKLVNKRTNAVIWIQAFPVNPTANDRALRVLMDDYVEAISGTGFYVVDVGDQQKKTVRAKTYATKVIDSKITILGGLDSYEATIELANVDQLRLDAAHREAMARVILIRTQYYHRWMNSRDPSRVVVRIGYEASPQDFEAGMPDFEKFLTLIEFGPPKTK